MPGTEDWPENDGGKKPKSIKIGDNIEFVECDELGEEVDLSPKTRKANGPLNRGGSNSAVNPEKNNGPEPGN